MLPVQRIFRTGFLCSPPMPKTQVKMESEFQYLRVTLSFKLRTLSQLLSKWNLLKDGTEPGITGTKVQ